MNDTDWKERAEKAEAELERVQSFRDRSASIHARTRDKLQNAGVQLSHLAEINASLTNKLQSVLAREAEMREVLEKTRHYNLGTPEGIPNEWFIRRDKVLATDAGTGYVHADDMVQALEGALVICRCFADGQEASPGFMDNNENVIRIKDALAKAKGLLATSEKPSNKS